MAFQRLSLKRGASDTLSVTFLKADNITPYNIKNWTVYFTVKTNWELQDSQASIQKIITTFSDTTSGTSGVAVIPILPTDTSALDIGEYDYDITAHTNNNENYPGIIIGKLDLEYNVTQSIGTAGTAI